MVVGVAQTVQEYLFPTAGLARGAAPHLWAMGRHGAGVEIGSPIGLGFLDSHRTEAFIEVG